MDLSLTLINNSWAIYSILEWSNYSSVFLSVNNENQCVSLLSLSSKFVTYGPSFILGRLVLEKATIELAS